MTIVINTAFAECLQSSQAAQCTAIRTTPVPTCHSFGTVNPLILKIKIGSQFIYASAFLHIK
jgi:hypothetical protein